MPPTFLEREVFDLIQKEGDATSTEISKALQITTQDTWRRLDGLLRKGMITIEDLKIRRV